MYEIYAMASNQALDVNSEHDLHNKLGEDSNRTYRYTNLSLLVSSGANNATAAGT